MSTWPRSTSITASRPPNRAAGRGAAQRRDRPEALERHPAGRRPGIRKGRYNTLFLSNYASLNIVDELKRVKGVGDVTIFGAQDYSMRVWLKPDRMAQLGLTASDIATAIKAQNAQNAAGKIGQEPAPDDQMLVYTVTAKGRLLTPEEFGNIVIRASGPGGVLRLKDVARIELGAYSYDQSVTLDGQPTIAMGVFLQTGANALEVAELVRAKMDTLKKKFPEGMDYVIPFDTTLFVSASITKWSRPWSKRCCWCWPWSICSCRAGAPR
jgi:multidrug efflux pump